MTNIIYAQTWFFVKTTSFSMQDFEISSNLLRRVAVQIFRADHQIFRSFFHPTNIQNPAWFVRRDRFRGPTHEQWWISRMITSRGGFACTERDRRTGMRTETVKNMISRYFCCVFFTTGRTICFLAGCAEPRCGDFKEWNSKFQGNTSFSVSKGTPGPQIVVSG